MESVYIFKTTKERLQTTGSALVGLTIMGVGLASVFNPVALGVVGAYAVYKTAPDLLMAMPAYRSWTMKRMIEKGHAVEVPEDAPVSRITREISDLLGRPEAPKVYTIDAETVAKLCLPLGFRWQMRIRSFSERAMLKVYGALSNANIIVTTKEALASHLPEQQLRFIIAHEMSHMKADKLSLRSYIRDIIKHTLQPLLWVTGITAFLSCYGVSVPLALRMSALQALDVFIALGALVAVKYATDAVINLGTRVVERRADRNALYITRDLDAAQDTMNFLHPASRRNPVSILREMMLSHPSYKRRMAALSRSFNTVSRYPLLQSVSNNTARQAQIAKLPGSA